MNKVLIITIIIIIIIINPLVEPMYGWLHHKKEELYVSSKLIH